jgi:hypothetical protein
MQKQSKQSNNLKKQNVSKHQSGGKRKVKGKNDRALVVKVGPAHPRPRLHPHPRPRPRSRTTVVCNIM